MKYSSILLEDLIKKFEDINSYLPIVIKYYSDNANLKHDFILTLNNLKNHLSHIQNSSRNILLFAPLFDADITIQSNGYRSMIAIVYKFLNHLRFKLMYICAFKESYWFSHISVVSEITELCLVFRQLRACLYYLERLKEFCYNNELFPNKEKLPFSEYIKAENLMLEVESIDPTVFYGKYLAFQYCESIIQPLKVVNISLATYSEIYIEQSSIFKKGKQLLVGASKYFLHENLRAKRVVKMNRLCDVNFFKNFWELAENAFIYSMIWLTSPSVSIDHILKLPCVHICINSLKSDHLVHVFAPSLNDPIKTRLISSKYRKGQEALFESSTNFIPFYSSLPTSQPSPYLVMHIHGGGFIGQSSASHELYLKDWAHQLEVPILSIDYSLAPKFKAPHQVEEAFYSYCWARQNSHILGWTGEKLILVGDSAGGNIAVALALKCIHLDIAQPDAIISIYGAFCVEYVPSPSRLLALMDPLIPMGVLATCLQAYVGKKPEYDTGMKLRNKTISNFIPSHQYFPFTSSTNHLFDSSKLDYGFFDTSTTISSASTPCLESHCKSNKYISFQIEDECSMETISSEAEEYIATLSVSDVRENSLNDIKNENNSDSNLTHEIAIYPKTTIINTAETLQANVNNLTNTHLKILNKINDQHCIEALNLIKIQSTSSTSNYINCMDKKIINDKCEKQILGRPKINETIQNLTLLNNEIKRSNEIFITGEKADFPKYTTETSIKIPLSTNNTICTNNKISEKIVENKILNAEIETPLEFASLICGGLSPMEISRETKIIDSPIISPLKASDNHLMKLCPLTLMAAELDPLLDDSIAMFARLKKVSGVNYPSTHLYIFRDLPHGFLNFVTTSHDAKIASDICITSIKKYMKM